MRFHSLEITNLRAIRHFSVTDLTDFVVIAGQNGCGKSCVFDALRLLKSVYGGYSANEYHMWFGEFAINLGDPSGLLKLFRNPSENIHIQATISFSGQEREYIRSNLQSLLQPLAWQTVTGQPVDFWTFSRLSVATQSRAFQPELTTMIASLSTEVLAHLDDECHIVAITITPSGEIRPVASPVVEVIFQAYAPQSLGVLEYHSASRSYSRQQVGGINLDTRAFEDQLRTQRLYNWQQKYQNIKTELASAYLRRLIAEKSNAEGLGSDLNDTLTELFRTFFPDKTYLGVRPQASGGLEFPVRLSTGEEHDIDEMSSGEKEILYGYLKLKNSTPRNSVLLLDEPELHLNPSLLQGFTDFYYRHLGVDQGNQLWLVTHSDTLLRQAVGNLNYRVYQMIPATSIENVTNQAAEVEADDDVERATIALVGDLAAYRPHGKVVVLEGEVGDGFDVRMIERLFPDHARKLNLISASNKRRVQGLYSVLSQVAERTGIKNRFFAVTDKDAGDDVPTGAAEYQWDVYHIENYLLHPSSIREVVNGLLGITIFENEASVTEALKSCAEELVDGIVLQRLQKEVNDSIVRCVTIKANPNTKNPVADLIPSIESSGIRLQEHIGKLDAASLSDRADLIREELRLSLQSEDWMARFPGRKILRRFADRHLEKKMDASLFLNAILDKMVQRGERPSGLEVVLLTILES